MDKNEHIKLTKAGKTRCQETVHYYIGRWPHARQCDFAAVAGTYKCKIHSKEAKAAREAKSTAAYRAKSEKLRTEFYGATFLKALRQIAAGHNDARGLATEIVNKFDGKDIE